MGIITKKGKSLQQITRLSFAALVCFVILLLGVSIRTTSRICQKQLEYSNKISLNLYVHELEGGMNSMSAFCQSVYSDNNDFYLLASKTADIPSKVSALRQLSALLDSGVFSAGALFIYDVDDSICLYRFGSSFIFDKKCQELAGSLMSYWSGLSPEQFGTWNILCDDTHSLLLYNYRMHNMIIGAMIDLDKIIVGKEDLPKDYLQFAFCTDTDILTNRSYMDSISMTPKDLVTPQAGNDLFLYASKYMVWQLPVSGTQLRLCCVMPLRYFLVYSDSALWLIPALFILLIGVIIILYFLLKIQLEKDNMYKAYETEHAMLQYYQLQTRSHFFLNCLKSLYNMLEGKSYERMKLMIFSFSNHLRFVFHDNASLVPLSAELTEIQDYYNIIALDRTVPIFIDQKIDNSVRKCLVPPLLIQTFLENSYKYNENEGKLLKFSIDIDRINLSDQDFIRIQIKDNGVGYPEEVLQKLNNLTENYFETHHIGIANLIRRIQLIFHEEYKAAFFNSSSGGACALICLPLRMETGDVT